MIVDTFPYLESMYTEAKFWVALGGALWTVFQGVTWVKAIRTNDLPHIQSGVDSLKTEVKEQTNSIVTELREMRGDIRSSFTVLATAQTAARSARSNRPRSPKPKSKK